MKVTRSMQQNPSWEANRFAASQEIPRISRSPMVHCRSHKCRHLSLSWVSSIHSMPPPPTYWRSILILSSHLRLCLPSGYFPSGFPTKTMYKPLPSTPPYALHAPPISFSMNIEGERCKIVPVHIMKACGRNRGTGPLIHNFGYRWK